jgi:AcrR family transcriptional regulator
VIVLVKYMPRRKTPRPAKLQTRQQRAQDTRARICDAAEALFQERGYSETTMAAIAKGAGVAVQTVYFVFHTKGLLLLEVLVRAAHERSVSLAEKPRPTFVEMVLAEQDPQRQLALLVEHFVDLIERVAPLWPYVQVATEGDAELTARLQEIVERRRAGIEQLCAMLEARNVLRVPAHVAAATLFLVLNPELSALSSSSLHWQATHYKAWAWQLAVVQLLGDAAPKAEALRGLSFAALPTR